MWNRRSRRQREGGGRAADGGGGGAAGRRAAGAAAAAGGAAAAGRAAERWASVRAGATGDRCARWACGRGRFSVAVLETLRAGRLDGTITSIAEEEQIAAEIAQSEAVTHLGD